MFSWGTKPKPDDSGNREGQLAAFYEKHEPSKIPEVVTLLANYPYEDIKASLLAKYGALPEGWGEDAPPASERERQLAAFYKTRDPSKIPEVGTLLAFEPWLPAEWFRGGSSVQRNFRRHVATTVSAAAWLDATLQPVLDELKEKGELESTVTIFTADHGAFFAGKGHPYEAGLRVPLLPRWPPLAVAGLVAVQAAGQP